MKAPGWRHALIFGSVAVLALGAGILSRSLDGEKESATATSPKTPQIADKGGQALLRVTLPDLEGNPQSLGRWQGKVLVVNFWATWCEPCKKEIPEFIKVQDTFREKGVVFIGIAIDEPDKVKAFAKEYGINYPLLIGGYSSLEVTREVGNSVSALPFTAILDRSGRAVATKLGGLDETKLVEIISPLI